jgi:hypothetical protein
MFNINFGAGARGSRSTKMMRLLAAPAPQHCLKVRILFLTRTLLLTEYNRIYRAPLRRKVFLLMANQWEVGNIHREPRDNFPLPAYILVPVFASSKRMVLPDVQSTQAKFQSKIESKYPLTAELGTTIQVCSIVIVYLCVIARLSAISQVVQGTSPLSTLTIIVIGNQESRNRHQLDNSSRIDYCVSIPTVDVHHWNDIDTSFLFSYTRCVFTLFGRAFCSLLLRIYSIRYNYSTLRDLYAMRK